VVVPEAVVRSWADLAGTYQALMLNSGLPNADSATDVRYPGRVTITMSSTGSFSGALDYMGTSYALAGALDAVTGSCSLSIQRGALPSIDFTLRLTESDLQNYTLSVAATELLRAPNTTRVAWLEQSQMSPISLKSTSTLQRAVGAASPLVGKTFTTIFKGASGASTTPGGYAILTVSSTGMVTLVSRLGEGTDSSTSVTNSTHLSADNVAAIYRPLYGIGQLAGTVQLRDLDPNAADNNAVQAVNGDLEWKNPGIISSFSITFPGSGYTLIPGVVITGGSGFGVQASAVLASGKVIALNITNPGYGFTSVPTVSIPKSAAQPYNSTFKQATATASIAPRTAACTPRPRVSPR
jgi:hypothetical protein